MNIFEYEIQLPEKFFFYVSVVEENIIVTNSFDESMTKKENVQDFSWGNCLQNIVIFGMSIMTDLCFQISDSSFKNALRQVLHRIKQFEKLGNIDLSRPVLILFLNEFYSLIQNWVLFVRKLQTVSIDDKKYIVDNTIGLLLTFHILLKSVGLHIF